MTGSCEDHEAAGKHGTDLGDVEVDWELGQVLVDFL